MKLQGQFYVLLHLDVKDSNRWKAKTHMPAVREKME